MVTDKNALAPEKVATCPFAALADGDLRLLLEGVLHRLTMSPCRQLERWSMATG